MDEFLGKLAMRVAEQDHVDPRHLFCQRVDGLFSRDLFGTEAGARIRIAFQSRMGDYHHQVRLPAHFRDDALGGIHDLFKLVTLVVRGKLPPRHSRRDETHDAYAHTGEALDDVGAEICDTLFGLHADVGGEYRKASFPLSSPEGCETKVEVGIAHRHGVVAERIHRRDHGVGLARVLASEIVGQRCALRGIAGVEQEHVGLLGADAADQRGDFRQATVGRLVCIVVPRLQVTVQVGGTKQGQANFGSRARSGVQGWRRRRKAKQAKQAEKAAARQEPRGSLTHSGYLAEFDECRKRAGDGNQQAEVLLGEVRPGFCGGSPLAGDLHDADHLVFDEDRGAHQLLNGLIMAAAERDALKHGGVPGAREVIKQLRAFLACGADGESARAGHGECSDGLQLFRDDELQKLVLSSKRQNSHLVGFGFEEASYLLTQACQVGWFGRPSLLGQLFHKVSQISRKLFAHFYPPVRTPSAHHYSQSAAGHCDDFAANAAKRHLENKKRSTYTEESAREDHALCSRMGQRWPSRRSDLTRFHRRPHRRGEVVQHHMAIHGASISAAGVRPDHSFFWRKLHSFTGIFPVGAFLAEHFWSNSYALVSVAKYNEASGELQTIPGRIFV